MKLERRTADGWMEFSDDAPVERCASHGDDQPEQTDRTIGLRVVTGAGRTLETGICGDCLTRALALYFGRQHVAAGGAVEDLADEDAPGGGE